MAGHKIVWKMHALFTTCQSVAFYWATRAVTNTRLFPEDSVSEECLWPLPHVCRWCGRCSRSLPWSQSRGTSASSLPSSWAPLHRVRTKRTSRHRHRPLLNTQRTSDLNSKLCWYCAQPKDYEWHTKQIDRSSNSTFLRAFWGRVRLEDSFFSHHRERGSRTLFSSHPNNPQSLRCYKYAGISTSLKIASGLSFLWKNILKWSFR